MPAEITTITGLDFDIDSMYLMLRKFMLTNEYNRTKSHNDFIDNSEQNWPTILNETAKAYPGKSDKEIKDITGYTDAYEAWFNINSKDYLVGQRFTYKKPNLNIPIEEMSTEMRNNLMIEISTKILQHPDLGKHSVNPGNFDTLRASSRRMDILDSDLGYS